MSNCLYEATLQKISKECGCNPIKFFKVDESFTACEDAKRHCMQKHLEDMGVERTITDGGIEKECWAACADQTYREGWGRHLTKVSFVLTPRTRFSYLFVVCDNALHWDQ